MVFKFLFNMYNSFLIINVYSVFRPDDCRSLPAMVEGDISQVSIRMVSKVHNIAAHPSSQPLKVVDSASSIDVTCLQFCNLEIKL